MRSLLQSVAWVKVPKGWSPSANLSRRAVEDGVKVNAVEGNVLQHGAHAQACVLENVVLANLQQPAVRGQATHCGLQLVICQRVERRIYTTSTRLCSNGEPQTLVEHEDHLYSGLPESHTLGPHEVPRRSPLCLHERDGLPGA